MTALDARARLQRLAAQRMEATAAGDSTPDDLAELTADIATCRDEFIALAVTEIASLRAHLSGPQKG